MKKLLPLLILQLLLVGAPVRSALPGPATLDSLLTLPNHEKSELIRRIIRDNNSGGTNDIYTRLQFVKELTQFFISKGTRQDVLLLQINAFLTGTSYPMDHEHTLNWGNAILKEAEVQKDTFAMASILGGIGTYYYKFMQNHVKSFECMWIVNRHILNLGPERYPGYEYSIYYLARSYFDFFDYENSIRHGKPLMKVSSDKVLDTHVYNACLLGMSYFYLHKPAEARRYFQWGLRYVPKVFGNSPVHKDVGWTGIFHGDIGLTYFLEEDYDRAIPYLKKGFDLTTQTQYWNNVPVFGAKLAHIYLMRNQLVEARKFASLSIEAAHKLDTIIYPKCRFIAEPYKVMSAYYRLTHQPSLGLAYADSARQAEARWKQFFDSGQMHQAEIALAQDEFLAREQKANGAREKQVLLRNGLLLLTLLIGIAVSLLYFRQKSRFRHHQQQLISEKQLTEIELENAQLQLSEIRKNVKRKSALIDQFREEMETMTIPFSHTESDLLQQLHQSVILTEEDWSSFVKLFEKVHPGFLVRLRFKLPELTPAEVRFMALCRLHYSNHEMAAMLGVGLGAIRQYRLRLRRKMNLPGAPEAEEIATII